MNNRLVIDIETLYSIHYMVHLYGDKRIQFGDSTGYQLNCV